MYQQLPELVSLFPKLKSVNFEKLLAEVGDAWKYWPRDVEGKFTTAAIEANYALRKPVEALMRPLAQLLETQEQVSRGQDGQP
jgi:hypothetical protein